MPNETTKPYTLSDTWHLNNRVTLLLLDHLSDEQLAFTPTSRSRTIADQFAHLHNVRIMWLEPRVPSAAQALTKIEKGAATKSALNQALTESAKALGEMIDSAENSGRLKGWKRGPAAFLGYALAHEGHHRGQIILHLKYAKLPVDRMFGFGLWEWEKA